jgi:hypothetical protein
MHIQTLLIDLLLLSSLVGFADAKRKTKSKKAGSVDDAGGKRMAQDEEKDAGDQGEKRSKSKTSNKLKTSDRKSAMLQESGNGRNDNDRPVDAERAFVFSWHRNDLNIKTDDYRCVKVDACITTYIYVFASKFYIFCKVGKQGDRVRQRIQSCDPELEEGASRHTYRLNDEY